MATKAEELRILAQEIKNETQVGANTAERVGTALEQAANGLAELLQNNGDYYCGEQSSLEDAIASVPISYQKGGLTIHFHFPNTINNLSYILTNTSWSTNITDWQGVDDVPTAGSDNLVKSGGVEKYNPIYEGTDKNVGELLITIPANAKAVDISNIPLDINTNYILCLDKNIFTNISIWDTDWKVMVDNVAISKNYVPISIWHSIEKGELVVNTSNVDRTARITIYNESDIFSAGIWLKSQENARDIASIKPAIEKTKKYNPVYEGVDFPQNILSVTIPANATTFNVTSLSLDLRKDYVLCLDGNVFTKISIWDTDWHVMVDDIAIEKNFVKINVYNTIGTCRFTVNPSESERTANVYIYTQDEVFTAGIHLKLENLTNNVDNISNDLSTVNNRITKTFDTIFTRTKRVVDYSKNRKGYNVKTWVTSANMYDESTYLYSEENAIITEIVAVKNGDKIKLTKYSKSTGTTLPYVLFDTNGQLVRFASSSYIEIDTDGYIMFHFANEQNVPEGIFYVDNSDEWIDARTPYYHKDFQEIPYFYNEKPLDVIIRGGGWMTLLHDFGVIGDSLSVGCMESPDPDNPSPLEGDNIEYSWQKNIARLTGTTNHNFAKGGAYVHDNNWWNSKSAAVAADPCNSYIIAIGYNDQSWLTDDITRLGTIEDIKTDYTQNPNTFYGMYGKIVQYLLSFSPNAKIFFMTCPFYEFTLEGNVQYKINEAIKDICEHFNGYLLDMCKYAPFPTYGVPVVGKTGVIHLNSVGYMDAAFKILSYVDYIIRHNLEDFTAMQLIEVNTPT